MTPAEIPNDALSLSDIPETNADFELIANFGYTFDGFKQLGSFGACADIAYREKHDSLTELRACLFFEQRRWQHYGDEPDEEAQLYQRDVVAKIRELVEQGGSRTA